VFVQSSSRFWRLASWRLISPSLSLASVILDCPTNHTLSSTIFAHSYPTHVSKSFGSFFGFLQGSGLWGWVKWEWRKCFQIYRANFISAYFISPHVLLLSGPEITIARGYGELRQSESLAKMNSESREIGVQPDFVCYPLVRGAQEIGGICPSLKPQ